MLVNGVLLLGLLTSNGTLHATSRVSLAETVYLPPSSEKLVLARVLKPALDITAVLEPSSVGEGLHIGSVMVEMQEKVPIRILNLNDVL